MKVISLLLILFLQTPVVVAGNGMTSLWLGTPFMEGWVPDGAPAIRGVYITNGMPMNNTWEAALTTWNFALLRINTDTYGSSLPDGPEYAPLSKRHALLESVVRQGLRRLAQETGHPEIEWVPLVASGYSRFSPSAAQIMTLFPDRALAYMNGHNGKGEDPLTHFQVPSLGLMCEWENIFSGGDKTALQGEDWWVRHEKTLATCAIHWRVYHNPNAFADLGIIFVDDVIRARIPEDWDPRSGPCTLKPVDVAQGWLGSHATWRTPADKILDVDHDNPEIAPLPEFKGDPSHSSWLINERFAWAWRAFSSRFPPLTFTEPGVPSVGYFSNPSPAPNAHRESGVRAGKPFVVSAIAHLDNVVKMEVYADTALLGTCETYTGGESAIGSSRNATFSMEVTIPEPGIKALSGRYVLADGKSGWMRVLPLVVQPALPETP